jgi:hypothetical protein
MSENPDDPIIRKTIGLPRSIWGRIADLRAAQRPIQSEAEAIRRMLYEALRTRNETLEAAARTVLAEAVTPDVPPLGKPDPTDISYNIALEHAAEAVLRMRR